MFYYSLTGCDKELIELLFDIIWMINSEVLRMDDNYNDDFVELGDEAEATPQDKKLVKQLKLKSEVMNSMTGTLEMLTTIYGFPTSEVVAEMSVALEELEKLVKA